MRGEIKRILAAAAFLVLLPNIYACSKNDELPLKANKAENVSIKEASVPEPDQSGVEPELEEDAFQSVSPDEEELVRENWKVLFDEGRFDEALILLEKDLAVEPENTFKIEALAAAYNLVGWKKMESGDTDRAEILFSRSIEVLPVAEAYHGRSLVYFNSGRTDMALSDIGLAVSIDGNNAASRRAAALISYEANRLDDAAENLEALISIEPGNLNARSFLAKVKREAGKSDFGEKGTSHFNILYEGVQNAKTGHLISMLLEEIYLGLGADLGFYPERAVTVILYTDRMFRDVTKAPSWAGGLYDGKIRLPAGGLSERTDVLISVLRHEYTHALIHQMTGGNCPVWLNEGLAQKSAGTERTEALAYVAGVNISLARLEGSFMGLGSQAAAIAYAWSFMAVDYIESVYGRIYFRYLLDELGKGSSIDDALSSVFYFSSEELDRRLFAYLKALNR